jgi:hypothetical protein
MEISELAEILNIAPIFFVCSLLTIWINSSSLKLNSSEKHAIGLFIWFFYYTSSLLLPLCYSGGSSRRIRKVGKTA